MNTKQVVAVIGASGSMGSAFARSLSKGNYRILLCSSKTNAIQSLLNEIKNSRFSADVEVVDDDIEACWEADVVILAVPYAAEKRIAETIRSVVNQKVVISISNPLNDNCDGLLTQPGISAAQELQRQLPNAKVVKAFNTVFASDFDQPVIQDQRLDCFIAGNDEDALEIVYELVKAAGFNPVIAGDLCVSGTLESMQLLLIQLVMQSQDKKVTGWKILQN
jgi:8-hydroxy-5-deazaflavin:NADPH oxidoreductase